MAQAITDVKTFLEDARQAVVELAEFEKQEETLAQEEKKRLRVLETERKAVADAVNSTVKKRRDEIEKSYDDELGKLQDKLKRTRTRREKAKNQGIKERIKEETQELHAHNRELAVRMRTLFQSDRVPFVCKSPLYYALYFPRGFKEFLTVLITFAICFLLIPCGIYKLLPEQKTLYLAMIYGVDVVVFGGLYILIGNWTKDRHLAALQEGRSIRSLIAANNRKIAVITSSIRRDRSEALYDLEKYDDEISQMEQDLEETAKKKKDFSKVRLFSYNEGLCVQCMHVGSYDAEPETLRQMDEYAAAQGYAVDFSKERFHHEIYLGDPRKTAPEKLKTVLRHPIRAV